MNNLERHTREREYQIQLIEKPLLIFNFLTQFCRIAIRYRETIVEFEPRGRVVTTRTLIDPDQFNLF